MGILHDILADLGAKALISSLADSSNRIKPILQDDSLYLCTSIKRKMRLSVGKTNQEVVNHIRGMNSGQVRILFVMVKY